MKPCKRFSRNDLTELFFFFFLQIPEAKRLEITGLIFNYEILF